MTMHVPTQPTGVVASNIHHRYLFLLIAVIALILAIAALLAAPAFTPRPGTPSVSDEHKSLIDDRTYERLDRAAGEAYRAWEAPIGFRVLERASH